ncbi:MAG: nitrogen regulation protein NR(II) [Proteobacteria bacterium]|nr:nitrogen regulation protein NR(II) [Pseudomonadota bacterium]MDA1332055.1 nitrogen regulation protein NR(II) [Pseudomonadota bacterium]
MNAVNEFSPFPGLELLSAAVVLIDKHNSISYINPAAEHLLDVSRKSAERSPLKKIFLNPSALLIGIEHTRKFRCSYIQHEITFQIHDEKKIELSFTVTPLEDFNEHDFLIEFFCPSRQIKIAREQRIILETNRSRELIRNLAHEIKNPLGAIRGAAQLLDRELDREDLHEYTSVIIKEADRLKNLLDRLLTPHKMPQMTEFNVHEVLERVRSVILAEYSSGLRIERDYDLSLPSLFGDYQQITQSLLNIARNAAQALRGQGLIKIKTRVSRRVTLANQFFKLGLLIEISDNGPGIPQSLIDKIFFPLISGRNDGSGLGLSLSQTFISHHSGTIDVKSQPGDTCFTVHIPIKPNKNVGEHTNG